MRYYSSIPASHDAVQRIPETGVSSGTTKYTAYKQADFISTAIQDETRDICAGWVKDKLYFPSSQPQTSTPHPLQLVVDFDVVARRNNSRFIFGAKVGVIGTECCICETGTVADGPSHGIACKTQNCANRSDKTHILQVQDGRTSIHLRICSDV